MKGDDVPVFASMSALDAGSILRWKTAAAETHRLLHEHEILVERRLTLYRERVALLRSMVRSSSSFVDDAIDGG